MKLLTAALLLIAVTAKAQNCPPGWTPGHDNVKHCNTPLPVNIVSFKAGIEGNKIKLNWVYNEAVNHSHFRIYHSANGVNFQEVGETTETNFSYETQTVNNYFRLSSLDTDGTEHHYKIIYIEKKTSYKVTNPYTLETKIYQRFEDIPKGKLLIINNRKTLIL